MTTYALCGTDNGLIGTERFDTLDAANLVARAANRFVHQVEIVEVTTPTTSQEITMNTTDTITSDTEAEAFDAEALIEASRAASMVPQGLDHHTSERIEMAMAVTERYGNWTDQGFRPYLVRPIEVDAKELALDSGKPLPVALRIVQRGIKEDATNADNLIARVVLNTNHVENLLAPHIVAIYTPMTSRAFKRGSVAVAFLYQPTEWVADDGRTLASWYNTQGFSGMVAEWADYDEAEADMVELRDAIATLRKASAYQARLDGEPDAEDTDAPAQRRPRSAAW